jgi:hypothetical protein
MLYSASPDDGALQPKHVVNIKTCVVFARKINSCEWGNVIVVFYRILTQQDALFHYYNFTVSVQLANKRGFKQKKNYKDCNFLWNESEQLDRNLLTFRGNVILSRTGLKSNPRSIWAASTEAVFTAAFMPTVNFNLEDGASTYLRNVCKLILNYTDYSILKYAAHFRRYSLPSVRDTESHSGRFWCRKLSPLCLQTWRIMY